MLELLVFGAVAVALLVPAVFNSAPIPGGSMNETLVGERGRIVRATPDVSHRLWVEVRGELWRAVYPGAEPPVGTEVDIVSVDGLLATVSTVRAGPPSATPHRGFAGWQSWKIGLVTWGVSCGLCWLALGSPAIAFIGVPGTIVIIVGSMAAIGDG